MLDDEVASPAGAIHTYRFGPRGDMPPVTLTWYDGGLRPPTPEGIDPGDAKQRLGDGGNGILFIGEKGMITCAGWAGMPRLLPLSLHTEYKRPEKTLPRSQGHHTDWLAACKGGPPASGNFEYSARLTELDFSLHLKVSMASGNLIYPLILNSFKKVYTHFTAAFFQMCASPNVLTEVQGYHAALIEALAAHDADKSAATMEEMLVRGEKQLMACLSSEGK